MKKFFIGVTVLAVLFGLYWFLLREKEGPGSPKQQALSVNKHSSVFNKSLDSTLTAYFSIKDAFVDADTMKIKIAVSGFLIQLDKLPLDELKKDTNIILDVVSGQLADIRANAVSISSGKDITAMRRDFSSVNENIYPLLKTIHYSGNTLYWQNCPMAFGENQPANWISNTEEIVNPYLGKNHPEYKGTMLHCGEVMDSIKAN